MTTPFAIEEKQPQLAQAMRSVGKHQRISHAYLFEGAQGVGQEEMATFMAAMIFCTGEAPKPCGHCAHCQRIQRQEYGDIVWVTPTDGSLKIDQIRAVKQDLSLSAIESESKVFVIQQAERMTPGAANSLLKFLEEPNANVYLFLLTTQREGILPTIRSRCQIVHFPALNQEQMLQALEEAGITRERARLLGALTSDIAEAEALNADEVFNTQVEKAWPWLQLILKQDIRAFTMVGTDWVPLTKDTEATQRLLAMILLYGYDLLMVKQALAPPLTLTQPQKQADYAGVIATFSMGAMVKIIHQIARSQAMIAHHVSVQAALEYFVLKSWDWLKMPN